MNRPIKNMTYLGRQYCKDVQRDLPTFSLVDLGADKWNAMAQKQNTKMFVEFHNRDAVSYGEVKDWVNSLKNKESHSAGNTEAFMGTF
ncbi:hypothetical protein CN378_12705 [Bacillus sp. AFS015802]|uniref:hypothetical protein n=1 Tax=Bacillus sp. AFS015802 TaxID=2033486 RepID=UPI000BFA7D34|nr:hypothetical protein [Bacillus sp. AFS015802]PFA66867.1 hypothetical protein CN378_12705 [Bacillus sp. AFS015802]